jgi:formylglycine-generating enzyme required for sulfatase activity
MKVLKYILFAGLFTLGLASCENTKREKTQDEIEQAWPSTITTMEAGDFVLVKRDTLGFTMGTKTVKLNKSFYMCTKEVTQAQWEAIMNNNPSDNEFIKEGANKANCPVNNITHAQATEFIKALNQATGRKFALPSEAQWEWAAIGGKLSNGYAFSGSDNSAEVAWSAIDYDATLNEVGQLKPNELGIYDMSGNIEEWTSTSKVTRGGHYETSSAEQLNVRYSNRNSFNSSYAIGLRLIIEEPLDIELIK